MKAQSIGDSFFTQNFSIGASSAGINAEKVPDRNFGCFWVVKFWLLFSYIASKIVFEHIVGMNMALFIKSLLFKVSFTGYV